MMVEPFLLENKNILAWTAFCISCTFTICLCIVAYFIVTTSPEFKNRREERRRSTRSTTTSTTRSSSTSGLEPETPSIMGLAKNVIF